MGDYDVDDILFRLSNISEDSESGHMEADDLILTFLEIKGYKEVAEKFREMKRKIVFYYS